MRHLVLTFLLCAALQPAPEVRWTPLSSGVTARLRGVSAFDDRTVWASGAEGTILRSEDGGATWARRTIPGTAKLDFRDVDAVDARTAYVLSIGPGEQSRIYKTTDAGLTWTEQFVNREPKAFFDAMAFLDPDRGVAIGDSIDGRFEILTTHDGGRTWSRVPSETLPPALPNEGAFAASGTNVAVHGASHVWIATGAARQSRVLRSSDGGRSWTLAPTPLASGPSAGAFSIAFRDERHGIVVGGDYRKEAEAVDNAAISDDGGATWTAVKGLSGFRSAVAAVPGTRSSFIAIGPSGSDYSGDDGRTWTPLGGPGFHAFSFAPSGGVGFAVGENGTVAKLALQIR